MKTLKTVSFVLIAATAVLAAWVAVRWNAPPLNIVHEPSGVTVDLSSFGEYPTTVKRIRLCQANDGQVLWEVRGNNGTTQLHAFRLKEGDNPAQIDTDHGRYHVVVPQQSPSFPLRAGVRYRLEAWRGSTVASRRTAVFELGGER
ncbi:MAG TPA: hypothetical protein VEG32_12280 [Clostridia bacterium]|nr:hypothetical protein [Clostridia bacterium]